MTRIVNFQTSLFGSFENFQADTDLVIRLLTCLREEGFIPGSVNSATVDVTTGKMLVNTRLQLLSPNRMWSIVFLDNRIDFNYSHQGDDKDVQELLQLMEYVSKLVGLVFSALSGIRGNRLAVNLKMLMEDMSENELNRKRNKYISPIKSLDSNDYIEWSVRLNSKTQISVGETEIEDSNRIFEVMRYNYPSPVETNRKKHSTVMVSIDINTMPEKYEMRFDHRNLLTYINNSKEHIISITKEIEENNE